MLTIHFYPLLANKALIIPFATSCQYIQREAWVLQKKKKRKRKGERKLKKEDKCPIMRSFSSSNSRIRLFTITILYPFITITTLSTIHHLSTTYLIFYTHAHLNLTV